MPTVQHTDDAPQTGIDVVVVGEALVDIVVSPGGTVVRPGGSPANVAYGLGRLGVDTMGAEGSLLTTRSTQVVVPSVKSAVADTIGAGDSYMAAPDLRTPHARSRRASALGAGIAGPHGIKSSSHHSTPPRRQPANVRGTSRGTPGASTDRHVKFPA